VTAWEAARQRALARADSDHERQRKQAVTAYAERWITMDALLRQLRDADATLADTRRSILHETWMPARPGRRMPPAPKIAAYWADRGEPFKVNPEEPACFACWDTADEWGHLERAHLVDRWAGGLDGPQNLAMLCNPCHRVMPIFLPGQDADAINLVLAGGFVPTVMTLALAGR